MQGYEQAITEYESRLFAPYDKGGAFYDWEKELKEKEEFEESRANDDFDCLREVFYQYMENEIDSYCWDY